MFYLSSGSYLSAGWPKPCSLKGSVYINSRGSFPGSSNSGSSCIFENPKFERVGAFCNFKRGKTTRAIAMSSWSASISYRAKGKIWQGMRHLLNTTEYNTNKFQSSPPHAENFCDSPCMPIARKSSWPTPLCRRHGEEYMYRQYAPGSSWIARTD